MKPYYSRPRESKCFTLVELMVVITIFSIAIAGAFSLFMGGYRVMFRTQAKLEVNAYLRRATNQMVMDGRSATYFILYDRFDGSLDLEKDATVPTFKNFRTNEGWGRRSVGESGNCLVFVYNGVNPTPYNPKSTAPVDRIVVYTLDTGDDPDNRVYRFRRGELVLYDPDDPLLDDENNPQRFQSVESLIPAAASGDNPARNLSVAIPLVRGMLDGNLFHRLDDKSVLINGHFFYGNPADDVGVRATKHATNVYSFTITPRGSA